MAGKSITVALNLDTSNFDKGIRDVNSDLNKLGQNASKSKSSINGLTAGLTALVGAAAGGFAIKGIVETTAQFQDLQGAFDTLFPTQDEAIKKFDEVGRLATELGTSADVMRDAFVLLKANGIEPTNEMLTAFVDMSKNSTEQLGAMEAAAVVFSRSINEGAVSLEELDKIADRGIPVYRMLAEQLGVTRGELLEFSKEGDNTKLVLDALITSFQQEFGGTAARELDTISSQMMVLKNVTDEAKNAIGQGMAPAIAEFTTILAEAIKNNQELATSIGVSLGNALKLVIENLDYVIALMGVAFGVAAINTLAAVVTSIMNIVKALSAARAALIGVQAFMGPAGWAAIGVGLAGVGVAIAASTAEFEKYEAQLEEVVVSTENMAETTAEALSRPVAQLEEIVVTAQRVSEVIVLTEEQKQEAMKRTNDLMAESDKMLEDIHKRALERGEEIVENVAAKNQALEREIEIAQEVIGLTDEERVLKTQLMELEYQRQDALENIAKLNVTAEERNRLTEELNGLTQEQIDLIKERHDTDMAAMDAEDAKAKENIKTRTDLYKDMNDTMKEINDTTMAAMEEGFIRFVETGKGSFKDLVDDMIRQLKRIIAKEIFKQIIGILSGGISKLFSGFLDSGGVIPQGKFGIVGEKGPEIVTGPARVIGRLDTAEILNNQANNSGGSTQVVYNINATDAQSFRDMIARDPGFIYNVTRAGARLQPI